MVSYDFSIFFAITATIPNSTHIFNAMMSKTLTSLVTTYLIKAKEIQSRVIGPIKRPPEQSQQKEIFSNQLLFFYELYTS